MHMYILHVCTCHARCTVMCNDYVALYVGVTSGSLNVSIISLSVLCLVVVAL